MLRTAISLSLLLPFAVFARPRVALPPPAFADTETTTNITFSIVDSHCLRFALTFAGTPSNNVQVALGVDSDTNGVLSPAETRLVVGWDCGKWFVRDHAAGRGYSTMAGEVAGMRSFEWHAVEPEGDEGGFLTIVADGELVFPELCSTMPDWIHNCDWDILRLTGRGADELRDSFLLSPGGFAVRIR